MPLSLRASQLIAALGAWAFLASVPARAESALGAAPAQVVGTATDGALGTTAQPGLIPAAPAQLPPAELDIRADRQGFDLMANRFVAVGNVQITLSGGRLLADRLDYDATTRTLSISGRIRLQRGSYYLQASRLRYSLIENSGELEEVYGVLDLDSAALDLNPSQPPTAPLQPLSYWDQLRAPFDQPLPLRPATAATGPPANNGSSSQTLEQLGDPIAAALQRQPLADQPQPPAGGSPQRLPDEQWRMPPVALSPAAQTMACPPALPPVPDWHPHPWSATLWGGQMYTANFGGTFTFNGAYRPEYLAGIGLQRRLFNGGPVALELDANLFTHFARSQPGGAFNQTTPLANTPSQTFGEGTLGLGARVWLQPWLNLFFEEGVSLLTESSNWERTEREKYAKFLNYLAFELEGLVSPQWSVVWRIHHRSGAYGTYSGVSEGSNAYLMGLRYRYGYDPAPRFGVAMAPASGCAGGPPEAPARPRSLLEQLNSVASGNANQALERPTRASNQSPRNASGPTPARQAAEREQAISALVDQRVENLSYQGNLSAERRFKPSSTEFDTLDEVNSYGTVRPVQLQSQLTESNKQLVRGTVTRWRLQANTLTITPSGWQGDRVALTNDPYTPAQSWVDARDVRAWMEANGDLVIKASSNQLILEDQLPIPLQNNQRFEKKRNLNNRWVLASDGKDRDGSYLGYNFDPIRFGSQGQGKLSLQPQFMVRRALDGTTNSYVLPGQPASDPPSSQPVQVGDLFGLLANVELPLLGMRANATLDASTFNPSNIANGTRSWGDLTRTLRLPLAGDVNARLFAAYRYRVWNGSLGEEDIYSAFGGLLEKQQTLPSWGRLSSNYLLRVGIGNFQGNDFASTNMADHWRASLYGSLNASYPIWTGQALPEGPLAANRYSAVPVVPGLSLNANTSLSLASYGSGNRQYGISLSGGPTLTLGHFSRNAFDWTQLTITGGGTLLQGESPFSFDRIVDLGTIGVGLTQQLIGPLVFSGGIGLNVDPNSPNYGDTTGSYVELRWQRRAYELAVYYSPYEQLGGIRVKVNDFNFRGTGLPFVPYNPAPGNPANRNPLF